MDYEYDPQRAEYISRVNLVLDHIERCVGENLSLAQLAAVAGFSPFHFHRVFRSIVGEPLYQFIQRIRLEKAATQLIGNPKKSITEIALACGFAGSATFARAFRQAYGVSATGWRRMHRGRLPDSKMGKARRKIGQDIVSAPGYSVVALSSDGLRVGEESYNGRSSMERTQPIQIGVENRPAMPVVYLRHIGPYQGNAALFEDLFGRLARWAGPRGLMGWPETKALVIYYDSPEITDEQKLRLDVCITVPAGTPGEGEVGTMTIPAGEYAFLRFELGPQDYQGAWDYVFRHWLPGSGYQADDRPCFELYHNDGADHPEMKALVDICVAVKPF